MNSFERQNKLSMIWFRGRCLSDSNQATLLVLIDI